MKNKFVRLFSEDNIQYWVKLEDYHSKIEDLSYTIITEMVIIKGNKKIWEHYNMHYSYDREDNINMVKYIDILHFYIKHTEDTGYIFNKRLNDFLLEMNTFDLLIFYKWKSRKIEEDKKLKEYEENNMKIEMLGKELQKEYNKKGYAVVLTYRVIYIIDKKHTNKNVIDNQNEEFYYKLFTEGENKDMYKKKFLYKIIDFTTVSELEKEIKLIKEV